MSEIKSFRDLRVYQELVNLHLTVHNPSLTFPKFELYELGSQLRRSSNSAPAQIAEGGRMLEKLHQSLTAWKGSVRSPTAVKEQRAVYGEDGFGFWVLGSGKK